jgi:conjugal transfer pilus assembly protein TraF
MRGKQMGKYLILVLFLVCSATTFAEDYYGQHEKGWYWFDDPTQKKTSAKEEQKDNDPTEEINADRIKVKQALDKAILNPTSENLYQYKILQDQAVERSNQFATAWQKMLLAHPEVDYSLKHPTNNVALQVYHENESKQKDVVLDQFAQHTGLFFFYRSTCPYCQRFAPILKHFAEAHHIVVIPITLDGIVLPEFPDSKHDSGQAKKFNVTVEPSLYAVDPISQKAFPVAFGLTSETELQNNIYNIMTHYQEGVT